MVTVAQQIDTGARHGSVAPTPTRRRCVVCVVCVVLGWRMVSDRASTLPGKIAWIAPVYTAWTAHVDAAAHIHAAAHAHIHAAAHVDLGRL
jgi:hypothetical protein